MSDNHLEKMILMAKKEVDQAQKQVDLLEVELALAKATLANRLADMNYYTTRKCLLEQKDKIEGRVRQSDPDPILDRAERGEYLSPEDFFEAA